MEIAENINLLIILEDRSISIFSLFHNQGTGSTLVTKQRTPSTDYALT
jgi:hypothetical protein